MTVPLLGPFALDPNVCVALFVLDDRLWVFGRRALHADPDGPNLAVLHFDDVRAHRMQCRDAASDAAVLLDNAEFAIWAVEVPDSEYLPQVIAADERRTAADLAAHKHYVVRNGHHGRIDIVARSVRFDARHGLLPDVLDSIACELFFE